LARGIDGVAHRAALQAGGRTLAVLAGGLLRIYPPEHTDLAQEVEGAGALLTEAAMGQDPLAPLFPAVPGPIDSPASGGTHELLRKGAVLCRGVEDVLEELHGVSAVVKAEVRTAAAPAPAGPPPGLDEPQRNVWEFLAGGARTLDEMAQHLGLGVSQLTGVLMMLEMKKAVRRLPGNRYERC
jgi:DNA processing protein